MSKEAIKNLLMDFMADYDPNKWSNDDVYEKYAEKIDNVRSMGEIIAFTELTKKVKDLEHRLSNCIEPKFKVGQKLYVIGEKFMGKTLIDEVEYFGENIDGIITFEEGCRCGCTPDRYSVEKRENVFATKEEAKARLEELKNG